MTDAEYIEQLARVQDRFAMEARAGGMFNTANSHATFAEAIRCRLPLFKLKGDDVLHAQVYCSDGQVCLRGDAHSGMLMDAAELAYSLSNPGTGVD